MAWALAGCANPGPPRPPSLDLPSVVRDLRVSRIAQRVEADWTTPNTNTEKTGISGPITAVLCRDSAAEDAATTPVGSSGSMRSPTACVEVARRQVSPGASTLEVDLPADLVSGPVRLLAYRVELLNVHGRSAGYSQLVWAAAGSAPQAAGKIQAEARPRGVQITWTAAAAGEGNGPMELVRRTLALAPAKPGIPAPPVANQRASASGNVPGRVAKVSGMEEVRLSHSQSSDGTMSSGQTGAAKAAQDPGGLLDTSAVAGATYRYVAQRVRYVTLGGHALQIAGEASAPVQVTYRDIFPPSAPRGLQAIAVGQLAVNPSAGLAVDLSWEPSPEDDVAGYNVLRRDAGSSGTGTRLNNAPVVAPAYRDTTVAAGRQYVYQVTAVDSHGNVSAPGAAVHVTLEP